MERSNCSHASLTPVAYSYLFCVPDRYVYLACTQSVAMTSQKTAAKTPHQGFTEACKGKIACQSRASPAKGMKNGELHDDDNDNDGEMKGAGSQQWV